MRRLAATDDRHERNLLTLAFGLLVFNFLVTQVSGDINDNRTLLLAASLASAAGPLWAWYAGDGVTAVLIYHDVVEPDAADGVGFPGRLAGRYKHTPEAFDRHLDAIAATGRRVGLVGTGADVALTFDDGGSSAPAIAELLERRGWRGHFLRHHGAHRNTPGSRTRTRCEGWRRPVMTSAATRTRIRTISVGWPPPTSRASGS